MRAISVEEGVGRLDGDEVLRYHAQAIQGVLPKMPESEQLVPSWFAGTETMFDSLRIPENISGTLILPFLTKLRDVENRVERGAMPQYVKLKEAILQEW